MADDQIPAPPSGNIVDGPPPASVAPSQPNTPNNTQANPIPPPPSGSIVDKAPEAPDYSLEKSDAYKNQAWRSIIDHVEARDLPGAARSFYSLFQNPHEALTQYSHPEEIATGVAKSAGQTANFVSEGISKILPSVVRPQDVQNLKGAETLNTPSEHTGAAIETLAEFMLGDEALKGLQGLSKAEKLAKLIPNMKMLENSPKLAKLVGAAYRVAKLTGLSAGVAAAHPVEGQTRTQAAGEGALGGAVLGTGGEALSATAEALPKMITRALRPAVETVGNTEVPVRNPGAIAKTAQKMVPTERLENFAKEQTGPAVAKGIGETAKQVAGTEGEVAPTETDRLGIRGVADEVKQRSQDVFKKLDEVSGNMLSEAQQMADDASGDFSSKGRKEYRQAMDMQDAIFDNYKGHSELQGMDLDKAKTDWKQQVALRDISKKLSSATESSESGAQDYQFKQGKQLAESVDSLVKNDKDVLQRAGFSDDHIDQLQKFGRIIREQADTPRFAGYWGGIAKSVAGAVGFHDGGFGGALGAMAGETLAEHAGGYLADKLLGKVLTTPSALDTFNSQFGKIPPAQMAEELKSQIAKADPTWAEKIAANLSNLWHNDNGELTIPGTGGTAEGAASDTRLFQQAKAENPTGSVSDWAKRAQELKDQPQAKYEYDPTGSFGEGEKFGNIQHKVTTTVKGQKIGELAAQDTAPGVVTVRSNQIYDDAFKGKGYGKSHLMHLFKNAADSGAKTVNSDISVTLDGQRPWESLEKRFPDAVTKKVYADGRPQWTVNLKALKDRLDFEGADYTNTERRAARRAPMNATELEDAMKNRKPIQTPFDVTQGAQQTINSDKAMPAYPGK